MSEPNSHEEFSELEKRLRQLHRSEPLNPQFARHLEARLADQGAKIRDEPAHTKRSAFHNLSLTTRRLAWVMGAALMVLVLAWGIQNLLPAGRGTSGGSQQVQVTSQKEAQPEMAIPSFAPSPQPTASASDPLWIRYQDALAAHFMPWIEDKGVVLCEWEVYGQRDASVYLWALCLADEAHNGTGVSAPAVLHLGQNGEVEGVESPGDGTLYGPDVQRLFPPDAQERIFAHDFDVRAAEANIALRRQDPSIPPLAAGTQAEPPPELSGAVSAGEIDRLALLGQWGRGEARQAFFSPDGGQLALLTSQGVAFFDTGTWEQQRIMPAESTAVQVAFSPDWQVMAWSSGPDIRLLRVSDGRLMQNLQSWQARISELAFSPDGSMLAALAKPPGEEVYTGFVELWNVADGSLIKTWDSDGNGLAFSLDGKLLATWYAMSGIRLWHLPDGSAAGRILGEMPKRAVFMPDGGIQILQAADGQQLNILAGHNQQVQDLAFTDLGQLVSTSMEEMRFWKASTGEALDRILIPGGWVDNVATSGNFPATHSLMDGTVRLWDPVRRNLLRTLETPGGGYAGSLAFSRGGSFLALGQNTSVYQWQVSNGELLQTWEIGQRVNAIAFSPDGSLLALGLDDGTVQLRAASDGELLRTPSGHTAGVSDLAFSWNGRYLASASRDGTIQLWGVK